MVLESAPVLRSEVCCLVVIEFLHVDFFNVVSHFLSSNWIVKLRTLFDLVMKFQVLLIVAFLQLFFKF